MVRQEDRGHMTARLQFNPRMLPLDPPTGRMTLQGVEFGSRRVPRTIPKNAVHVPTFFRETLLYLRLDIFAVSSRDYPKPIVKREGNSLGSKPGGYKGIMSP